MMIKNFMKIVELNILLFKSLRKQTAVSEARSTRKLLLFIKMTVECDIKKLLVRGFRGFLLAVFLFRSLVVEKKI